MLPKINMTLRFVAARSFANFHTMHVCDKRLKYAMLITLNFVE